MKREYSQPNILFESFSLTENIAAASGGCTRNITNQYSGQCGLRQGNKILFTWEAAGCKTKIEDGSEMLDGLCYNLPSGENRLFNS